MMLTVRGSALAELDPVRPVQMVDSSDLDAVRCNDIHMFGDPAANSDCVSRSTGAGEIAATAFILERRRIGRVSPKARRIPFPPAR
jgi:hypothetical protein